MNIHSTNLMRVGSFRGLPQFIQGSLFLYLISFASMAQPLRPRAASQQWTRSALTARQWSQKFDLRRRDSPGSYGRDFTRHVGYLRADGHAYRSVRKYANNHHQSGGDRAQF